MKSIVGWNLALICLAGTLAACANLPDAIGKDDDETVKKLLASSSTDVNKRGDKGNTALHIAIAKNNKNTVEALLKRGADPLIKNDSGATAVQIALDLIGDQTKKKNGLDFLRLFVENGLSLDSVFDYSWLNEKPTALPLSLIYIREAPFSEVMYEEWLAKQNFNPNIPGNGIYIGTPLQEAVARKKLILIRRCLALGGDVELKNTAGESAIEIAAKMVDYNNDIQSLKMLIPKDQSIVNISTRNPKMLHNAVSPSKLNTVEFLLKEGVSANILIFFDQDDRPPLYHVVFNKYSKQGDLETIKLLVKYGADLNWKDRFGNNYLHIAAQGDANFAIVDYLLKNKVDENAVNLKNETPLQIAKSLGNKSIIAALDQSARKIQERFVTSVNTGDPEGVRTALREGANVNAKNVQGKIIQYPNASEEVKQIIVAERQRIVAEQQRIDDTLRAERQRIEAAFLKAAKDHNSYTLLQILDDGVDARTKDSGGNNALMLYMNSSWWISIGSNVDFEKDFFARLIKQGLDPKEKNAEGKTSLDIFQETFVYCLNFETRNKSTNFETLAINNQINKRYERNYNTLKEILYQKK